MDAADSLYMATQLMEIRAGLYELQYGKLKADQWLHFNTTIDRGVEQYMVRTIDQAGSPVPMKGRESNIPSIKATTKGATINFHSFALGYDYSLQEGHAAAFVGQPLPALYALLCRERQARQLDMLCLVGDTAQGLNPAGGTDILGLFNQTGTLTYTAASDGSGGLKTFDSKNPDQINRDMNATLNQIITNSFEVEAPDTLILPVTTETMLAQVRVGDGTSSTILTFFKANRPEVTVGRSMYLETAGAGATKRMVAYQNDPTRVEALVSVMFDQTAPQFNGYIVKTMTEIRTAGCALYLPDSVDYADGI